MSARRMIDVAVASVALAVLAPLLAAIALAVRLTSPGPVLFRQPRAGRGGRPFALFKFRTMWHDAGGPCVTRAADARITPIGAHLRRWKLDELPQLLNILRGDMTILGPRPEIPEYLARLGPTGQSYAAIQPGLADVATLAFYDEGRLLAAAANPERYYLDHILPAKARLSIAYAHDRTLISDLRLASSLAGCILGLSRKESALRYGDVVRR
jgi:lipopolysaccharide/colanic/teichoic acid biosynthesis glycosyltransferase